MADSDDDKTQNQGSTESQNSEEFAELFAESERSSPAAAGKGPAVGDVVSGRVISVSAENVFVDLGGKSEGVLETEEVRDADGVVTVAAGDMVEARVVDAGESSGVVVLRRTLGKGPEARAELELAFEHQIEIEGVVTGVNKGGFEVQVAGVEAFCPVSQIDARYVEEPETYVGQKLQFRITRYEAFGRSANIVLSRRVILEEAIAEQAAATRDRLKVGAVLQGTVRSIEDYGAFVDLGGVEGMLHISELGYSRVEHPSEVVEVGDEIEVQVLKIERTDNPRRPEKIGLSLKSLAADPWEEITSKLAAGDRVHGKVVRIEQFGAFVELAAGVEGLVHISQMGGGQRLSSPRKVVDVGQNVHVTVLKIDSDARRISLSIDRAVRDAQAAEEREAIEQYAGGKEGFGTLADLLNDQLGKK